jgi:hypothetical protein
MRCQGSLNQKDCSGAHADAPFILMIVRQEIANHNFELWGILRTGKHFLLTEIHLFLLKLFFKRHLQPFAFWKTSEINL